MADDCVPDELAEWLNDYISRVRWQAAKSGPPHEYTVKAWRPDHVHEFHRANLIIREFGHTEKFWRKTYTYLTIGDLKYWAMADDPQDDGVINRAGAHTSYGNDAVETPKPEMGIFF